MPGSVTILSRTDNGSAAWEVPTEARSVPITFRVIAVGTADPAGGSVALHQGSALGATIVYDTTAATTLAPSATSPAAASDTFEATGNQYWQAILTGITADTTVSVVASW